MRAHRLSCGRPAHRRSASPTAPPASQRSHAGGKTAVCSKAAANHQVRASHAINKEMWRRFVVQFFYWKNAVRPERGDTRLPLVQSVAPANAPCSHKVNFAVSRSTRAPDKLQIQGRGQQQALSHPHQLYTQGSACMCHNRLQSTQAICLHTHTYSEAAWVWANLGTEAGER